MARELKLVFIGRRLPRDEILARLDLSGNYLDTHRNAPGGVAISRPACAPAHWSLLDRGERFLRLHIVAAFQREAVER